MGNDLETFWKNLVAGECGIDKITSFDATNYDSQIAGEVKNFEAAPAFPSPKEVQQGEIVFRNFGVYAAWQAAEGFGPGSPKENRDEIGVIV